MKSAHGPQTHNSSAHPRRAVNIFPWRATVFLICGTVLLAGCANRISGPSKLSQKAAPGMGTPPAGKSLVIIHRPRGSYGDFTDVWDSTHFIADLGSGNSTAYACEPGRHYFINRSNERVGVVEAQLLPDQTYGLWVKQSAGMLMYVFQLVPLKRGTEEWRESEKCVKENLWVTRGAAGAAQEQKWSPEIEVILRDFVGGPKEKRLQHLGPDDYW